MTMAATAGREVRTGGMTAEERKVIFASSLGTVFEWYDFYIYGTLGRVPRQSTSFPTCRRECRDSSSRCWPSRPASLVRPFGALPFGHLGDRLGRKYTFLHHHHPDGPCETDGGRHRSQFPRDRRVLRPSSSSG